MIAGFIHLLARRNCTFAGERFCYYLSPLKSMIWIHSNFNAAFNECDLCGVCSWWLCAPASFGHHAGVHPVVFSFLFYVCSKSATSFFLNFSHICNFWLYFNYELLIKWHTVDVITSRGIRSEWIDDTFKEYSRIDKITDDEVHYFKSIGDNENTIW